MQAEEIKSRIEIFFSQDFSLILTSPEHQAIKAMKEYSDAVRDEQFIVIDQQGKKIMINPSMIMLIKEL